VTLANFQANEVVPHGPGMGNHVAPIQQLCGKFQKCFGVPWVLNPRPSSSPSAITKSPFTNTPPSYLLNEKSLMLFKFECIVVWAEGGWGIAPAHVFITLCDHHKTKGAGTICIGVFDKTLALGSQADPTRPGAIPLKGV
jgi:hypothetical protein